MYSSGTYQCISFSSNKPLNIGKGGMIFTDNYDAVKWLKKARYEGRSECHLMEDSFDMLGWNMYMTPEQAARGLLLMANFKSKTVYPIYPDLSKFPIYSKGSK
jgi:dTDP-4-amino-4,6-dideoxygalactose transaminase